MQTAGNMIWLIFGGLWTSFLYFLGGCALCLTIVGIPFGIAALRLARANLLPFGKSIVTDAHDGSVRRLVFNGLWLVMFGWSIAVSHLTSAALLALSIVGLPWALQHLKLVPLSLLPFGRHLALAPSSRVTTVST